MKHDCMRKQMIFLHDGEIVNINNSGIELIYRLFEIGFFSDQRDIP